MTLTGHIILNFAYREDTYQLFSVSVLVYDEININIAVEN